MFNVRLCTKICKIRKQNNTFTMNAKRRRIRIVIRKKQSYTKTVKPTETGRPSWFAKIMQILKRISPQEPSNVI